MSDQIRISDSGELEVQPLTWDGEPLYSPATVADGLFNADAFEQMPGQMSMGTNQNIKAEDLRAGDVIIRNGFQDVVHGDPVDFEDGTVGIYFRGSAAIVVDHNHLITRVAS